MKAHPFPTLAKAAFVALSFLAISPALAVEGIGNDDGLVMVVDVMDVKPLDGPQGEAGKNPPWSPELVGDTANPTALDFTGIEKPGPKATLLDANLVIGDGAEVKEGDLVVVDYLGSIYGAKKPFDESYTKEPIQLPLGSFVEGFNEALEGKTVGSRVLMRIPPAKGYGDQAQGEDIPANSTLYFVVDILAAI